MKRINKAIDLLAQGQPVYYDSVRELSRASGQKMAATWGDYIRLDLEHGAFDMAGLGRFMQGLVEAGPTASGHLTPAVIAELPVDGVSRPVMEANAWMAKQVLAQGVHGILLCHAESPEAVAALVEAMRFPLHQQGVGQGLGVGRRGHGGQEEAAPRWGLSPGAYMERADLWPLNPQGELLLGVKIENQRALAAVRETLVVPGLAFAEWGPGDMGLSLGFADRHDPPYPPAMLAARDLVKEICEQRGLFFLEQVDAAGVAHSLDEGVMICRPMDEGCVELGRRHSGRPRPW